MNRAVLFLGITWLFACLVFSSFVKANDISTASELKNRFRIDHMVSEITIVVQREYGSPPVVIVLPDGRKWYAHRHPENVKWLDGMTGDMIKISQPQAGPWQLLGRISDGSTITKVSELNIEVQPLPQPLYVGERVKALAQLNADGHQMRLPGLDYLVEWSVAFKRLSDEEGEKKTAGKRRIGSYKDDGKLLDEKPDDGIFTSNFHLELEPGKYLFDVRAHNEVFDRHYSEPILLKPIPVSSSVINPALGDNIRYLQITSDTNEINISDSVIEYTIMGPNNLNERYVIQGLESPRERIKLPHIEAYGNYVVSAFAAATTVKGREILLHLSDITFNLEQPPEPGKSELEIAQEQAQQIKNKEESAKRTILYWVVSLNVVLILLGVISFIVWRKLQVRKKAIKAAEEMVVINSDQVDSVSSDDSLNDIDLTMPEDGNK
ncbi:TIGR03503 family protein [Parashewanella tropica]|uniref:TIGR03503 family protein n=1 Tax=Parashewanella tropica TaxID=2547970 RepID=UPI001059D435|nr:TIGR03503 family protein [Parashewanella tropica]